MDVRMQSRQTVSLAKAICFVILELTASPWGQSLTKNLTRSSADHNVAMVVKSFEILRKAGFDNVTLILSVPSRDDHSRLGTARCPRRWPWARASFRYDVIYERRQPFVRQLRGGIRVIRRFACEC